MGRSMKDHAHKLTGFRAADPRARALRMGADSAPRSLTHVMVVDDDPVTCQVISTILRARGYQVSVRAEALGTMAAVSREKPDVIVLDVNMPGLSGDALARLVANKQGDATQVILHSSQPESQLRALAREAGALGGIEKGDPRTFLPAFESLLARRA